MLDKSCVRVSQQWPLDKGRVPPPPLAHARPCLSTGWALNRRFEEILGPLFLWSRMEDWVFVECLYREKGLSRVCDSALCS